MVDPWLISSFVFLINKILIACIQHYIKGQTFLDVGYLGDIEILKARKVSRYRPPLDKEEVTVISMYLFHS